jgi:hypothetical protein
MKHLRTFEVFINESSSDSPSYWKSYEKDHPMQDESGAKKETNIKNIESLVDYRIKHWKEEDESGEIINDLSIMRIKGEAYRFFSSFQYINTNVIDAMIMQLAK